MPLLTTSTAINMFIKAVLREYKIPFEIYDNTFYCKNNQESIKSLKELEPDFVEVDAKKLVHSIRTNQLFC